MMQSERKQHLMGNCVRHMEALLQSSVLNILAPPPVMIFTPHTGVSEVNNNNKAPALNFQSVMYSLWHLTSLLQEGVRGGSPSGDGPALLCLLFQDTIQLTVMHVLLWLSTREKINRTVKLNIFILQRKWETGSKREQRRPSASVKYVEVASVLPVKAQPSDPESFPAGEELRGSLMCWT